MSGLAVDFWHLIFFLWQYLHAVLFFAFHEQHDAVFFFIIRPCMVFGLWLACDVALQTLDALACVDCGCFAFHLLACAELALLFLEGLAIRAKRRFVHEID
jgi:hypothetical protein